jgi:hypothetical protein
MNIIIIYTCSILCVPYVLCLSFKCVFLFYFYVCKKNNNISACLFTCNYNKLKSVKSDLALLNSISNIFIIIYCFIFCLVMYMP